MALPVDKNMWCRALFLVDCHDEYRLSLYYHEKLLQPVWEKTPKPSTQVLARWLKHLGAAEYGVVCNRFCGKNHWKTNPRRANVKLRKIHLRNPIPAQTSLLASEPTTTYHIIKTSSFFGGPWGSTNTAKALHLQGLLHCHLGVLVFSDCT